MKKFFVLLSLVLIFILSGCLSKEVSDLSKESEINIIEKRNLPPTEFETYIDYAFLTDKNGNKVFINRFSVNEAYIFLKKERNFNEPVNIKFLTAAYSNFNLNTYQKVIKTIFCDGLYTLDFSWKDENTIIVKLVSFQATGPNSNSSFGIDAKYSVTESWIPNELYLDISKGYLDIRKNERASISAYIKHPKSGKKYNVNAEIEIYDGNTLLQDKYSIVATKEARYSIRAKYFNLHTSGIINCGYSPQILNVSSPKFEDFIYPGNGNTGGGYETVKYVSNVIGTQEICYSWSIVYQEIDWERSEGDNIEYSTYAKDTSSNKNPIFKRRFPHRLKRGDKVITSLNVWNVYGKTEIASFETIVN